MTSVEEFAFIAAQLDWLETHLRGADATAADTRMEGALNALACAQAVIFQLASISSGTSELDKPPAKPVA